MPRRLPTWVGWHIRRPEVDVERLGMGEGAQNKTGAVAPGYLKGSGSTRPYGRPFWQCRLVTDASSRNGQGQGDMKTCLAGNYSQD